MDEVQVRAINIANDKNLPEFPTLMFEFIGTGKAGCLSKWLAYLCVLDKIQDSNGWDLVLEPIWCHGNC